MHQPSVHRSMQLVRPVPRNPEQQVRICQVSGTGATVRLSGQSGYERSLVHLVPAAFPSGTPPARLQLRTNPRAGSLAMAPHC